MLRPYCRGALHVVMTRIFLFFMFRCLWGRSRFLLASRAYVNIFAQRNLQRLQHIFFAEAEALAIGNIAHVRAKLSIGPQEISDRGEQMLDVIILLDQGSDVAGRTRRRNILERLRRLRIKAHARDILRKHRDKRQPKTLIKIGDELIARHLFERAIVARAMLERQMPVHVVRIPPGVLQALPEKPRLANPSNLMAPRNNALFAILPHQLTQSVHQFRLQFLKPLVIRPKLRRTGSGNALLARRVVETLRIAVRWCKKSWLGRSNSVVVVEAHSPIPAEIAAVELWYC